MANTKSTKKNTKKGNTTKTTKKTITTKKAPAKKPTTKKEPVVKEEVKKVTPKKEQVKEKKVEVKKVEETKEVKEEVKTSKKKIIIISFATIIIISILVILCITVFFNKERKITNRVKALGEEYYTKYYYDALSKNRSKKDVKKILSRFNEIGIKINMENFEKLSNGKYKDELKTFKSESKKCDKKNTKAIIYPLKPYGKYDYKIEVELDCGF